MKRRARDTAQLKPYAGQRFYLSLASNSLATALRTDLLLLGAEVEECFSNQVTRVVADVDNPLPAGSSGTPSPGTPGMPSPGSPLPSPHSPSASTLSNQMSRAAKIVGKACVTKHRGTANILRSTERLNIPVLTSRCMRKELDSHLARLPAHVKHGAPRDQANKGTRVKQLAWSWLKFEDTSLRFRPVTQQLTRRPQLCLTAVTAGSPFTVCPGDEAGVVEQKGLGRRQQDGKGQQEGRGQQEGKGQQESRGQQSGRVQTAVVTRPPPATRHSPRRSKPSVAHRHMPDRISRGTQQSDHNNLLERKGNVTKSRDMDMIQKPERSRISTKRPYKPVDMSQPHAQTESHEGDKSHHMRSYGMEKGNAESKSRDVRTCEVKYRDVEKMRQTRIEEKKKKGYCEMCGVTFDDFAKHRVCDSHVAYVREERHFTQLDALLDTVTPHMAAFLRDTLVYQQEHRRQYLDETEIQAEVQLVKESLPASGGSSESESDKASALVPPSRPDQSDIAQHMDQLLRPLAEYEERDNSVSSKRDSLPCQKSASAEQAVASPSPVALAVHETVANPSRVGWVSIDETRSKHESSRSSNTISTKQARCKSERTNSSSTPPRLKSPQRPLQNPVTPSTRQTRYKPANTVDALSPRATKPLADDTESQSLAACARQSRARNRNILGNSNSLQLHSPVTPSRTLRTRNNVSGSPLSNQSIRSPMKTNSKALRSPSTRKLQSDQHEHGVTSQQTRERMLTPLSPDRNKVISPSRPSTSVRHTRNSAMQSSPATRLKTEKPSGPGLSPKRNTNIALLGAPEPSPKRARTQRNTDTHGDYSAPPRTPSHSVGTVSQSPQPKNCRVSLTRIDLEKSPYTKRKQKATDVGVVTHKLSDEALCNDGKETSSPLKRIRVEKESETGKYPQHINRFHNSPKSPRLRAKTNAELSENLRETEAFPGQPVVGKTYSPQVPSVSSKQTACADNQETGEMHQSSSPPMDLTSLGRMSSALKDLDWGNIQFQSRRSCVKSDSSQKDSKKGKMRGGGDVNGNDMETQSGACAPYSPQIRQPESPPSPGAAETLAIEQLPGGPLTETKSKMGNPQKLYTYGANLKAEAGNLEIQRNNGSEAKVEVGIPQEQYVNSSELKADAGISQYCGGPGARDGMREVRVTLCRKEVDEYLHRAKPICTAHTNCVAAGKEHSHIPDSVTCDRHCFKSAPEEVSVDIQRKIKRKVRRRLETSIHVLSTRSVSVLLTSDPAHHDFPGFTSGVESGDSGLSYTELSEVELTDHSDLEWVFDPPEPKPHHPGNYNPRFANNTNTAAPRDVTIPAYDDSTDAYDADMAVDFCDVMEERDGVGEDSVDGTLLNRVVSRFLEDSDPFLTSPLKEQVPPKHQTPPSRRKCHPQHAFSPQRRRSPRKQGTDSVLRQCGLFTALTSRADVTELAKNAKMSDLTQIACCVGLFSDPTNGTKRQQQKPRMKRGRNSAVYDKENINQNCNNEARELETQPKSSVSVSGDLRPRTEMDAEREKACCEGNKFNRSRSEEVSSSSRVCLPGSVQVDPDKSDPDPEPSSEEVDSEITFHFKSPEMKHSLKRPLQSDSQTPTKSQRMEINCEQKQLTESDPSQGLLMVKGDDEVFFYSISVPNQQSVTSAKEVKAGSLQNHKVVISPKKEQDCRKKAQHGGEHSSPPTLASCVAMDMSRCLATGGQCANPEPHLTTTPQGLAQPPVLQRALPGNPDTPQQLALCAATSSFAWSPPALHKETSTLDGSYQPLHKETNSLTCSPPLLLKESSSVADMSPPLLCMQSMCSPPSDTGGLRQLISSKEGSALDCGSPPVLQFMGSNADCGQGSSENQVFNCQTAEDLSNHVSMESSPYEHMGTQTCRLDRSARLGLLVAKLTRRGGCLCNEHHHGDQCQDN